MNRIRVVLADDHPLLRAGVRASLADSGEFEVVGEAGSGQEALRLVQQLAPDVLLTDISMEGMNGLELVARVAREHPDTRSIVLSMHTAKEYVSQALTAGAAGYLVKDLAAEEVGRAIRCVADGGSYLSPTISAPILGEYVRLVEAHKEATDPLTPRQREILKLVAEGAATKAIARRLGISVKTVEAHRTQVMERLDIHDIAGLVRYAIRTGLVSPES